MVSLNTRQAYSEIDTFLNLIDEESRNKKPKKLREFFKREKDSNYIKEINPNISVKEQNLKKETLSIIAFLNLQYWCEDEEEKQRLINIYKENEAKYKEKINEKLKFNNVIDTNEIKEDKLEEHSIVEYKKSFFQRILAKIKAIIKKK